MSQSNKKKIKEQKKLNKDKIFSKDLGKVVTISVLLGLGVGIIFALFQ